MDLQLYTALHCGHRICEHETTCRKHKYIGTTKCIVQVGTNKTHENAWLGRGRSERHRNKSRFEGYVEHPSLQFENESEEKEARFKIMDTPIAL